MGNVAVIRAAMGRETLLKKSALVLGGSLLIAAAAQVSVPFYPVPLTLQTLAVLLVGLTLGSRLGALTLLVYLGEGAAGLPVFAGAGASASLIGPTAGFLFGFVAMAWLAGLAVERGVARGVASTAAVAAILSLLLYLPGAAWPMALAGAVGVSGSWTGASMDAILAHWISPFLLGDAVKAVIAALIVTGASSVMGRRRG